MADLLVVTAGVAAFILGQGVLKVVIEPVQQLKAAIGQTSATLLLHQPRITTVVRNSEISGLLRGHAAEIVSKAAVVSLYSQAALFFHLPSREDIKLAAEALMRLAHEMRSEEDRQKEISEGRIVMEEPMSSPTHILKIIEDKLRVRTTWL